MTDFESTLAREHESLRLPASLRSQSRLFPRLVLAYLFPHFEPPDGERSLEVLRARFRAILQEAIVPLVSEGSSRCREIGDGFQDALPSIREALILDAQAMHDADPAAESLDEVILAYPGFFAMAIHRIAHHFYECGTPFFPRILSELAHRETGIDIHPGATIGPSFAIDHGTGVVIGETTSIGARVRIFQGVTLGALSVEKRLANSRRHPTLEDDVVVYANATILGGTTVIGKGSVIGGNVWLTRSVPPGSIVTHASTLKTPGAPAEELLEFNI